MQRRVLVTSAGTALSSNLVRSLRSAEPSILLVGCHTDRFILKKSSADRNYVLRAPARADLASTLERLVLAERIDLVIPTNDADVELVSSMRERLPGRVFLPRPATIRLCQDKYALTCALRAHGLPAPATYPIATLEDVEPAFLALGTPARAWCRIRSGTCSMGATPVSTPEQARAWIMYWNQMRGVPVNHFTLSEYLPGRDIACQSLWQDGRLVLIRTFERISYVGAASRPSGVSSIAALARSVAEPRVAQTCAAVVRTVDPVASGVFSIDLKEDGAGVPCVTEINAGRFFTMLTLFDVAGARSMTGTYVRLGFGERVDIPEPYDVIEDYYAVRDVDTEPEIFHASDLSKGIRDAEVRGGRHAE
jgi:carbamoyl-phosphate synthase large subunit